VAQPQLEAVGMKHGQNSFLRTLSLSHMEILLLAVGYKLFRGRSHVNPGPDPKPGTCQVLNKHLV
jgi:hypothetical protein